MTPKRRTRFEGDPPKGAHMIVQHRPGQALAMPKGAHMGIVIDPTHPSPFHNLGLLRVSEHEIAFKCLCNPGCSVVYAFKRNGQTGEHTPR